MTRMTKTWVLLSMFGALTASAADAQEIRPGPTVVLDSGEGLTVHGHAEMKVKPDVAYVEVGVVTQARDSSRAVQENASRAAALMTALRGAGIGEGDIQTQFYGVQPQYDYQAHQAALTGYEVTDTVRVTVHDLTKVGQVIDKTTAAGGNQVNGITFDLTDRGKAEGQVLAQAVAEIRTKATVMAQAAGVTLGRLRSLSEGTAPLVQPLVMARGVMFKAAVEAPETPVSPQEITVTADVTAVYAMGL